MSVNKVVDARSKIGPFEKNVSNKIFFESEKKKKKKKNLILKKSLSLWRAKLKFYFYYNFLNTAQNWPKSWENAIYSLINILFFQSFLPFSIFSEIGQNKILFK